MPFVQKFNEWPRYDPEHYEVKGTSYMSYKYPRVPIGICFTLRPAVLELKDVLGQVHHVIHSTKCVKWPSNNLIH